MATGLQRQLMNAGPDTARALAPDLLLMIEGNPLANINLAAGFRLSSHRDDRGNRQQCFCFSQGSGGRANDQCRKAWAAKWTTNHS
jgi:hypothetical protein